MNCKPNQLCEVIGPREGQVSDPFEREALVGRFITTRALMYHPGTQEPCWTYHEPNIRLGCKCCINVAILDDWLRPISGDPDALTVDDTNDVQVFA